MGWAAIPSMIVGIALVLSYSVFGGFRAVVYSDLIQFFIMCASVFIVLVFSFGTLGSPQILVDQLPTHYFSLTGQYSWGQTLVWGFIALSTLVDPTFYHRAFAASSTKVAQKGIFISTGIWICFDLCTTFGAMYARVAIPEADSASAYLTYAMQLLPHGLRGFVLAGIVATVLSTLDSDLFLAGSVISYDILPKKLHTKISVHYLSILIVGVISVFMAILFEGNIKEAWKTLGSYSTACLLVPVLVGQVRGKNKYKDFDFISATLLGVIVTSYWKWSTRSGFWVDVDELYIGSIAAFLGLHLSLLPIFKNMLKTR
jgi:SSS family solute:Na+ symporter